MVSIQQKMGREKISSMNEQRHSYHRVYIFNCLQNSGFQLERILCEQYVLLWQLLLENFKFQLQFFVQNLINLHVPKGAS